MKTFEFKDRNLDLTIAGQHFRVNCVSEIADKIRDHQPTLATLGEGIRAGTKTNDDAVEICQEITDEILGSGAFETIFQGRTPTVTDCSDVLNFTIGALTEHFKSVQPGNGNRAARRAAKHKNKK